MAAGVGAGTLIENTAQASYDGGDGTRTVDSNTVVLTVDELLDVTVASLESGALGTSPGSAVLKFELTNTGNGPEAYELSVDTVVAGNDFDATLDGIAVDTNGNGEYDPGIDTILPAGGTTDVLDADANLTVFVLLTVPDSAGDGDQSDIALRADAVTGTGAPGTVFVGQGVDGTNAIVGSGSATSNAPGALIVGITTVQLDKTASILDPFGGSNAIPGAVVTFTITANVTGSGSVDDLVVTDAIPDGTTYETGTLALGGSALTDASGDDAGEASASGISVDLGTVPGGESRAITFDVTID